MAVMVMVMVMAATTACDGFCLVNLSSILSYYGPSALVIVIERSWEQKETKQNNSRNLLSHHGAWPRKHFKNHKLKPLLQFFFYFFVVNTTPKKFERALFIPQTGLTPVRNEWIDTHTIHPLQLYQRYGSNWNLPNQTVVLWCRSQCGHQTSCLFLRSPNRGAADRLRFSWSRIFDRYHSHN